MPCMRCENLIPNGRTIQLANGIMCPECLPVEIVDIIERCHANTRLFHYWNGVGETPGTYLIVDTLTPDMLNSAYYRSINKLVCLDTTPSLDDVYTGYIEYLILAPNTTLTDTTLHCSLMASGNLALDNCSVDTVYLGGYVDKVVFKRTTPTRSVRHLGSCSNNFSSVTMNHIECGSLPYYANVDSINFVLESCCMETINIGTPGQLDITRCKIDSLTVNASLASIIMRDSTIGEYEREYIPAHESYTNCTLNIEDGYPLLHTDNCILNTRDIKECFICHKNTTPRNSRIIKGSIVHVSCMERDSYRYNKFEYVGSNVKLPAFGLELELYNNGDNTESYEENIFDLILHGFVRCSDGSVSDEMKSPVLKSDKWLLNARPYLENSIQYINHSCGTHIHVATSESARRYYQYHDSVFRTMTEVMTDNHKMTEKIWGRYFCDYATSIVDSDNRYSWLNLESHHPTLEYRLPKLVSIEQYRRLVYFVRMFTLKLEQLHESSFSTVKIGRELRSFYTDFVSKVERKG